MLYNLMRTAQPAPDGTFYARDLELLEANAWIQFATARAGKLFTPAEAATYADELTAEFRKRFTSEASA